MKTRRVWWSKRGPIVLTLTGLLGVVGVSMALWLPASSGSKEADLASALLSGVVVGVVLVFVGKTFSAATVQAQDDAAMQLSSGLTQIQDNVDLSPSTTTVPSTGINHTESSGARSPTSAPTGQTFSVIYEEFTRDSSRVSAYLIKLRVVIESEYFQFVTIPVPYPELRRVITSIPGVPLNQLLWQVARSAEEPLINAIEVGEIPKDDRNIAYEVTAIPLESALRSALRNKKRNEAIPDETLYTFKATRNSRRIDDQSNS